MVTPRRLRDSIRFEIAFWFLRKTRLSRFPRWFGDLMMRWFDL